MEKPLRVDQSVSRYRRAGLGIFGVLLMVLGLIFWLLPSASASMTYASGTCVKSGFVLLLAWFAFPKIDGYKFWLFAVILCGLLFVAFQPKILAAVLRSAIFLVPVFFLIWLLRPRQKTAASRPVPRK